MSNVNYNNFAKTFSNSRKNMKWEEIYYFFSKIQNIWWLNILDVWCWSWRLINHINEYFNDEFFYTWIDSSSDMLLEAKKEYSNYEFLCKNMTEISLDKKYDFIFFIASFHHLNNLEDRIKVLTNLKKQIKLETKIFMTNWDLRSNLNFDKYKDCIIPDSENQFWSFDYNIKIWDYYRYYHSFSLKELEYIFDESWYKIIENRLFDNNKNIISIIKSI